ncbi:MAG: N-6 DNA methylase [Planctomycetota bacterium]
MPSDIVGRIFQKLIGPEERHRYGQHFTGDDVVDLINAFCIRDGGDSVLDPACGSGSFLVRAYYRKRHLDPNRQHLDQLADLFGCDIALYPAHLATLNLAAREINDEANYPRIVRRDFFDTERGKPFCTLPDNAGGTMPVNLPDLDAVVGNPPYVRQEKIDKSDKPRYAALVTGAWADVKLSGRADLHCYFWPVATKLLKPDGYFGFLTSSSWLDVEYGFALQGWILRHFKLLAIMESNAEPWFTDARVRTVATILQRCDDETERMANLVRFVRFDKPLRDIIGAPAGAMKPSGNRRSNGCATASWPLRSMRKTKRCGSSSSCNGTCGPTAYGPARFCATLRPTKPTPKTPTTATRREPRRTPHRKCRLTTRTTWRSTKATTWPASGAATSAPRTSTST